MKYLFAFIILISFKVLANHTKIDNDLINLMSNNKSTEIGIHYIKQHEYDKAINFFLLEVDKKNMDGSVNLGLIYEYLKNDYIKAEKYYNLSAFSNNAYGQYNLGILYYIVKKEKNEGYKWISCSANQGYLLAIEARSYLLNNNMIEKKDAALIEKDLDC